jgi:hypothetical protein
MERTTMVRQYIDWHPVAADEQQRGLEGWSVASTANPHAAAGSA